MSGSIDRTLTVRGGFLICPFCRVNRHLLKVQPGTEARELVVWCRVCKREIVVDIQRGGGASLSGGSGQA